MKYLKRILGLPFFLMLNIIGIIFHLFKISKLFILYGGEAMAYDKKTTPKMIADIYYKLEKKASKKKVCSNDNLQCADYKTACENCLIAFYNYKMINHKK
ncbi:hypothetical protein [Flavobacterium capsici]|uniref:Uncharacterized protein n=1 Tax=Flavobacterium capsici TaxID=3075618 RepID=A0AA96F148_9FLAO|nr:MULTISPECIES: hypothetical protein [unclassified Flavobacterium]WNM19265.1 hypothetical protein RN608_00950 [Flavobacterium sp. PMR2A8]WNM20654.1 hypothetical protein RN605_08120 [Flavobacterium sp. PMTSA4]